MAPRKPQPASLSKETKRLRDAMVGEKPPRFWWTRHGREEMANDDIQEPDIERVCFAGAVTWIETKKDELWHVEGVDLDGRSIRVVMSLFEEGDGNVIKVITAMVLKPPN
jgi:hypothetical protein